MIPEIVLLWGQPHRGRFERLGLVPHLTTIHSCQPRGARTCVNRTQRNRGSACRPRHCRGRHMLLRVGEGFESSMNLRGSSTTTAPALQKRHAAGRLGRVDHLFDPDHPQSVLCGCRSDCGTKEMNNLSNLLACGISLVGPGSGCPSSSAW